MKKIILLSIVFFSFGVFNSFADSSDVCNSVGGYLKINGQDVYILGTLDKLVNPGFNVQTSGAMAYNTSDWYQYDPCSTSTLYSLSFVNPLFFTSNRWGKIAKNLSDGKYYFVEGSYDGSFFNGTYFGFPSLPSGYQWLIGDGGISSITYFGNSNTLVASGTNFQYFLSKYGTGSNTLDGGIFLKYDSSQQYFSYYSIYGVYLGHLTHFDAGIFSGLSSIRVNSQNFEVLLFNWTNGSTPNKQSYAILYNKVTGAITDYLGPQNYWGDHFGVGVSQDGNLLLLLGTDTSYIPAYVEVVETSIDSVPFVSLSHYTGTIQVSGFLNSSNFYFYKRSGDYQGDLYDVRKSSGDIRLWANSYHYNGTGIDSIENSVSLDTSAGTDISLLGSNIVYKALTNTFYISTNNSNGQIYSYSFSSASGVTDFNSTPTFYFQDYNNFVFKGVTISLDSTYGIPGGIDYGTSQFLIGSYYSALNNSYDTYYQYQGNLYEKTNTGFIIGGDTFGTINTGSTNSGSTNSGSTNSGSTNSGSTNSGSTNSGSTNSGSTDSGFFSGLFSSLSSIISSGFSTLKDSISSVLGSLGDKIEAGFSSLTGLFSGSGSIGTLNQKNPLSSTGFTGLNTSGEGLLNINIGDTGSPVIGDVFSTEYGNVTTCRMFSDNDTFMYYSNGTVALNIPVPHLYFDSLDWIVGKVLAIFEGPVNSILVVVGIVTPFGENDRDYCLFGTIMHYSNDKIFQNTQYYNKFTFIDYIVLFATYSFIFGSYLVYRGFLKPVQESGPSETKRQIIQTDKGGRVLSTKNYVIRTEKRPLTSKRK